MNGVNTGPEVAAVAEEKMLERVVGRLVSEFGDVHKDRIEGVVREEQAVFADGTVREFVPVLVERVARRRLACDRPQARGEQRPQEIVGWDGDAACRAGRCWDCPEA